MDPWLRARGHTLTFTHFHAGDLPPESGPAPDWLIVMGGPMGVHDEASLPWLKAEKRALRAALDRGAAVLGVCLGAQLMADALGAAVTRNAHKEIGWHKVELSPEAKATWLGLAFPEDFTPFHWHGDTFAIPAGAVPLGSSAACRNQGFLWNDRALALQFHPEVTPASLEALAQNCGDELAIAGGEHGRYVQDAAALRAGLEGASALNAMVAQACLRLESRAACA
jgi:GMP synthase-like glutamine amidotransferase